MSDDEKAFLHKMASPLAGLTMLVDTILEDVPAEEDELMIRERLDEIKIGIARMQEMLSARKNGENK